MFKRKKPIEEKVIFYPKKPKPIRHTIAIASGKGGVGKSTVTSHLAVGLAKAGFQVGLIDADIYGPSQPRLFGMQNIKAEMTRTGKIKPVLVQGIHIISAPMLLEKETAIIWRAPMATKLIRDFLTRVDWPRLDFLLIDLPPGTGDIQITLAQQATLTGALIVTTPQQIAFQIAEKAMQMFRKVNIPILGVIENMSGFVCENCQHENDIFSHGGADHLAKAYNTSVLARIPLERAIVALGDDGKTLFDQFQSSRALTVYQGLVDALPKQLTRLTEDLNLPQAVELQDGMLRIAWADGSVKFLQAYPLRLNCTCALCVDEHTGQPLLDPASVSKTLQLLSQAPVGRYGVKLAFSDGHNTGIYTYEKLKKLNPYEVCRMQEPMVVASSDVLDQARVQTVLDQYVNPAVGQHGGVIELQAVKDNIVYVKMLGGCQGCSQASVTLKNHVWRLLRQHFPAVKDLVDVTEHTLGENPYY